MPERLEDSIRATAPAPDDDFLARLDRRVEEGFAKAPKPTRAPKRRGRFGLLLHRPGAAFAACAVIVVASGTFAVTVLQRDDTSVTSSAVSEQILPAVEDDSGGGGSAASASGAPTSPSSARVVERFTTIDLRTSEDEFPDTTAGVLAVADRTGTIVESSNVSEDDGRGEATYDLRVPTSRLNEALAGLSRLGDVTRRSTSTDDITSAAVSARDELTDARDRRAALLSALERAETDRQRASIERRLRVTRRQIAYAQARVRQLAARGNRARVELTVTSTEPKQGAWTPADALDDAGRILQVIAGVLLVAGAVLLPLGLVLAALLGASRLTKRRRREAVLG